MHYDYETCERLYREQFSTMSLTEDGLRYLMVRTLIDHETLRASPALRQWLQIGAQRWDIQMIWNLRRQVFTDSSIPLSDLNNLLRSVYRETFVMRGWNIRRIARSLKSVSKQGDEYWKAWNRVFRDDIRAHIQHRFVRSPSIQTHEELLSRIDADLNPVITGYTVISWYNQWSSALTEHIVLSHPRVVPAARRIDKVDFFLDDLPVDLKITFVPQGYIKSLRLGRIPVSSAVMNQIRKHPLSLAQWLYENQGTSRFSDSHRIFVMLADEERLEDSWKLKSEFSHIKKAVNRFLSEPAPLRPLSWRFHSRTISGSFTTYTGVMVVTREKYR
ncbi:MAG: hypothetical protein RMM08_02195 [Armatimonadota bacterium]|nr:hypothetical protein [Armatimonadota bacterium]